MNIKVGDRVRVTEECYDSERNRDIPIGAIGIVVEIESEGCFIVTFGTERYGLCDFDFEVIGGANEH